MSKSKMFVALFLFALPAAWGCTSSTGGTGGQGGRGAQGGSAGNSSVAAGGQSGSGAGAIAGNGGAGGTASLGAPCNASAAATSGIDPTRRIDSLTMAEKTILCDWVASRYCGYGVMVSCGDGGTLYSPDSQDSCVANMTATSCPATVGDSEDCEHQTTCDNPLPDPCLIAAACQ